MSNSIKVVARFRPQNRAEIDLGGQPIVAFESEDTCVLDVCSHLPFRLVKMKYFNKMTEQRSSRVLYLRPRLRYELEAK
jgi:hypothetical protein